MAFPGGRLQGWEGWTWEDQEVNAIGVHYVKFSNNQSKYYTKSIFVIHCFPQVYVCVCVHACMHALTCVCMCLWRSEVNTGLSLSPCY